jgi:hypothetical protein
MVTTTAALDQWPLTLTVEESATASVRLRPQCALFFRRRLAYPLLLLHAIPRHCRGPLPEASARRSKYLALGAIQCEAARQKLINARDDGPQAPPYRGRSSPVRDWRREDCQSAGLASERAGGAEAGRGHQCRRRLGVRESRRCSHEPPKPRGRPVQDSLSLRRR